MYLFGYASWTFKPQKILEKEIITRIYKLLLPLRKCYLPFFLTQNDIFISPKQQAQALHSPYHENLS